MADKSEDFDKAVKFVFSCIGKGDFMLKAKQLDAIKCIYDGKVVFLWLPTGFGKSICYKTLPFVFNCKHRHVVLVVSPCHIIFGPPKYSDPPVQIFQK